MPNEELTQRGYYTADGLRGDPFGIYESFQIGATSLDALVKAGLQTILPPEIAFPFKAYKPPKRVGLAKPDRLVARRDAGGLRPVAVVEHKAPNELGTDLKVLTAAEQAIFYGIALDIPVAGFTAEGWGVRYVDVAASRGLASQSTSATSARSMLASSRTSWPVTATSRRTRRR